MLYRSYLFTDKDPVIDELRTIWQDAGKPSFNRIEQDGGPSSATVDKWFNGDTRRPQAASVRAFARALGYDQKLTKVNKQGIPLIAPDDVWQAALKATNFIEKRREKRKALIRGKR